MIEIQKTQDYTVSWLDQCLNSPAFHYPFNSPVMYVVVCTKGPVIQSLNWSIRVNKSYSFAGNNDNGIIK